MNFLNKAGRTGALLKELLRHPETKGLDENQHSGAVQKVCGLSWIPPVISL